MKHVFIVLFFLISSIAQCQNFNEVDSKARLYPAYTSAEAIANQINKDFNSDIEKVRAIYTWLTSNISYDVQALYNGNSRINFTYTDQEDLRRKLAAVNEHTVNSTLQVKRAVCEGYAQTFKKISEHLGIPCLFIDGYSKTEIGDIDSNPEQGNHAWNAVRINNKWHLIDATWGAGFMNGNRWVKKFNDYYFFTNPDEFILSHLPSEPDLSFSRKKLSKKQFYSTPVFSKTFFKHKLKLISPLQGKISTKPNSEIAFKIEKIPSDIKLYYAYKGEKTPKEIETNCSESICSFTIPFTQNKDTELFIIVNRRTALQYKIEIQ